MRFVRPYNLHEVRNTFSSTEVGLTHPHRPSFIKMNDNGAIEIFAKPGLGIIIDPNTDSIIHVGGTVKFLTQDRDGIRWNKLSFNHKATSYTEPALVNYETEDTFNIYRGVDDLFAE